MAVSPSPSRMNPMMPAIIGAVVVVALVGGVAVAGYFGWQMLQQRGSAIPTMLAADTDMYVTFIPNLQDVPNIQSLLQAFPELEDDESAEAEVEPLDDFFTDTLGISFESDIQPWIGTEVGIGVSFDDAFYDSIGTTLSPIGMGDMGEMENVGEFYFIVQSRDDAQLNAFLDKVQAKFEEEGEPLTESDHSGVTIYTTGAEGDEHTVSLAIVKNHLVVANNMEGLNALIDRQEGDSLAQVENFQRVREQMPENAAAYGFFNGDFYRNLVTAMAESSEMSSLSTMQLSQAQIEAMRGAAFSLAVEENGIRLETISVLNNDTLSEEGRLYLEGMTQTSTQELAGLVSDQAFAMINFTMPESFPEQMVEALNANPDTETLLEDTEAQSGINLEEDIFSWMVGEGVLMVRPGSNDTLPVSAYLRLRSEKPDAAEAGLSNVIDAISEGSPEPLFVPEMIEGVEWNTMADPYIASEEPYAGYTIVGDDVIIALGGDAISEVGNRGNALVESETYRAAIAGLPENNTGVFYLNIQEVVALIDKFAPGTIDEDTQARLEPLVSLSGATESGFSDSGVIRAEYFLYIQAPAE